MKLDFEKRRQERNQLTEKLATLGIYQEKNDKSSKEIMQRKLPLFLS